MSLVQALGISKESLTHEGGTAKVCKKLRKTNNAKGMVDEDLLRSHPNLVKKLRVDNSSLSNKIKIFYNAQKCSYLFVLCPRLEEWVLEAARESDINVTNYALPEDADELHKKVNIKLGKFTNLIHKLKVESERVKNLKRLLEG
ncbi:hypothetical protein KAW50_06345 [candidate division WOR-3 bacterium]|nr:hypothetical protein [candidate division WOR-3 bacterium]